jgi:1,4-dihydroxy-2-naphthoate octaprenyltransferase
MWHFMDCGIFSQNHLLLKRSTIQLLRFPFSYFLMPVFWFALSFVHEVNWAKAALIFFLLHILLYPASNGYNSYMDRDEDSIGGIAKPLQPTQELFIVTVVMDIVASCLSFLVSAWFASAFIVYIISSRLYSYRGIRLKQFPYIGYLVVVLNQGALTFFMVYHGTHQSATIEVPIILLLAASFLIGGFYPITQVYQHAADKRDGVRTISIVLGKRGTFIFCALMYLAAFSLLFFYYKGQQQFGSFLVLQLFFIPVLVYFIGWVIKVWHNSDAADFRHTMQMNWLASTCTSLAFITLFIIQQIG